MRYYRKAKGQSALGQLVFVVLLAVVGMAIIKLTPIWIEDYQVGKALKQLESEEALYTMAPAEVQQKFEAKIPGKTLGKLSVTYAEGSLHLDYQVQRSVAFLAGISLSKEISHHVEVPARENRKAE